MISAARFGLPPKLGARYNCPRGIFTYAHEMHVQVDGKITRALRATKCSHNHREILAMSEIPVFQVACPSVASHVISSAVSTPA